MKTKARNVIALTTALPLAAIVAFMLTNPLPAQSEVEPIIDGGGPVTCMYAGQSYSVGAEIHGGCPGNLSQQCGSDGTWGACR